MPKVSGAGYLRGAFAFQAALAPWFNANTAVTMIDSFLPGFRLAIEKIRFVPSVTGTGAGATLTFDVRKGGPTGTIIATFTLTLAGTGLGVLTSAAVAAASDAIAELNDTDTFSITRQATGTVFTALEGTLEVIYRQRAQAKQ